MGDTFKNLKAMLRPRSASVDTQSSQAPLLDKRPASPASSSTRPSSFFGGPPSRTSSSSSLVPRRASTGADPLKAGMLDHRGSFDSMALPGKGLSRYVSPGGPPRRGSLPKTSPRRDSTSSAGSLDSQATRVPPHVRNTLPAQVLDKGVWKFVNADDPRHPEHPLNPHHSPPKFFHLESRRGSVDTVSTDRTRVNPPQLNPDALPVQMEIDGVLTFVEVNDVRHPQHPDNPDYTPPPPSGNSKLTAQDAIDAMNARLAQGRSEEPKGGRLDGFTRRFSEGMASGMASFKTALDKGLSGTSTPSARTFTQPVDPGKTPAERRMNFGILTSTASIGVNKMADPDTRSTVKAALLANDVSALSAFSTGSGPLRSFATGAYLAEKLRAKPLTDRPSPALKQAMADVQAWSARAMPSIQPLGDAGSHIEGKPRSDVEVAQLMAFMDEAVPLFKALDDAANPALKKSRTW